MVTKTMQDIMKAFTTPTVLFVVTGNTATAASSTDRKILRSLGLPDSFPMNDDSVLKAVSKAGYWLETQDAGELA